MEFYIYWKPYDWNNLWIDRYKTALPAVFQVDLFSKKTHGEPSQCVQPWEAAHRVVTGARPSGGDSNEAADAVILNDTLILLSLHLVNLPCFSIFGMGLANVSCTALFFA